MGDGRKAEKIKRQEILAAQRTRQKKKDRRSKFVIYGIGSVLILTMIGSVMSVMVVERGDKNKLTAAASKPIDGVQTSTDLSRGHSSNPVTFSEMPPVGGEHSQQLVNCGIYKNPVDTSRAVHSMEHGAVWVTYQPDLPQKQIDALAEMAKSNSYQLLSPYPGLASPVVASAWGKQLRMESAYDPRLVVFLKAYLQGPQTPEPGAPC